MHTTRHCKARQSQRGISLKMVDYVLTHGSLENDKIVLGRKKPSSAC
ncbi:hypothetical protein [Pseudomonas juntendi]